MSRPPRRSSSEIAWCPTAVNGRWVDGPRDDLFQKLREALGGFPFFAEDLGYITPEVHALRERLQIPGMAVLQFGFGDQGAHIYLPHRAAGKVIYTGTHDNNTTVGWWNSGATENERRAAEAYVGKCDDGIHWAFIRAAQELGIPFNADFNGAVQDGMGHYQLSTRNAERSSASSASCRVTSPSRLS